MPLALLLLMRSALKGGVRQHALELARKDKLKSRDDEAKAQKPDSKESSGMKEESRPSSSKRHIKTKELTRSELKRQSLEVSEELVKKQSKQSPSAQHANNYETL